MIKINSFFLSCFLLLSWSKSPSGNSLVPGIHSKDFLNLKGITITHQFDHSNENLSENKLIELQDKNGLTIWFGRYFHKDICTTGICRIVRLWIFWDVSGNYLGMQLDDNEPLTKSDHTPFELEDYERMDEIMADTASILNELLYEDLTVENPGGEKNEETLTSMSIFEVDGYSSATAPSLKEYVVKDAVYTCYTLWHTVYGETKHYIDSLLRERINPEYIARLLNGDKGQQLLALNNIQSRNSWFRKFEPKVLGLIASQDLDIAQKALSLITPKYLTDTCKQSGLAGLIKYSKPEIKYEILYKLQTINGISPATILHLFDLFNEGYIGQGAINHLFKIIEKQVETDNSIGDNMMIRERMDQLISHPDPYTSSLVRSLISKMKW